MSTRDQHTEFNQSLTRERGHLRNFHHQRSWKRPTTQTYRGHQLVAETPDNRHLQSYDLKTQNGDTLGSVELDHFQNADDFVRFIDAAINHDFETAVQWARNDLDWGFNQ